MTTSPASLSPQWTARLDAYATRGPPPGHTMDDLANRFTEQVMAEQPTASARAIHNLILQRLMRGRTAPTVPRKFY